MVKKMVKYSKFILCIALILSLVAPSYAALSASDGSAFVTKAEFDSALADFNARLTTFEAGINSKIDSQVTSYLDRNGIWNGKDQQFIPWKHTGADVNWTGSSAPPSNKLNTMTCQDPLRTTYISISSSGGAYVRSYAVVKDSPVNSITLLLCPSITKSGLLWISGSFWFDHIEMNVNCTTDSVMALTQNATEWFNPMLYSVNLDAFFDKTVTVDRSVFAGVVWEYMDPGALDFTPYSVLRVDCLSSILGVRNGLKVQKGDQAFRNSVKFTNGMFTRKGDAIMFSPGIMGFGNVAKTSQSPTYFAWGIGANDSSWEMTVY